MANFTTSNVNYVGRHNREDRRRNRPLNYIHDSTHESIGILITLIEPKIISNYYRDIYIGHNNYIMMIIVVLSLSSSLGFTLMNMQYSNKRKLTL